MRINKIIYCSMMKIIKRYILHDLIYIHFKSDKNYMLEVRLVIILGVAVEVRSEMKSSDC